jgi:ABC-2 type transport system ATP-binding protein
LIARLGGDHLIEFALHNGASITEEPLQRLPGVVAVRREEDAFCLAVTALHITLPALLQFLQREKSELARLTTRQASLEDVFVTLTGRHLRDEEAPDRTIK